MHSISSDVTGVMLRKLRALHCSTRRGWSLIIPGVLAATILFVALLWPTLSTNYRGFPPGIAHLIAALEMLISFSVCGIGIMFFYGLLSRPPHAMTAGETATTGAADRSVAVVSSRSELARLSRSLLAALCAGFFGWAHLVTTGANIGGPKVQKITPIRPDDEFYQVSKNLVDPDVARDSWRLDIVGQVENPRVYSFADIAAMPAVEQETTLALYFLRSRQRPLLERYLERRSAADTPRAGKAEA